MAYTVKLSTFARMDRRSITSYLAQYSVKAPNNFKRELRKYIGIVGETPNIFSVYDTNPEYRHVVVYGSYVMFYAVDETEKSVYIYRILHGSQDITNIL